MKIMIVIGAIIALEAAARADAPTAEDLYAEGQVAYNHTDYAAAITKWQASYELSNENGLLFNLAQARRLSGDCAGALATYRHFIAGDPTADQKPLAEDLVRELEAKCGATSRPVVDRPKLSARPDPVDRLNLGNLLNDHKDRIPRPGRTLRIAGFATGGAGAALLATGLLIGHHGQAIGDEVTGACRTTCDWTTWKDKDATGRSDVAIGRALGVAGAVGIVSGAALYYLGIRQETVTVSPASLEGGAVISWNGSW